MPNKDPTFLMLLYEAITNSTTWQGVIMAMIIAVLRLMYDEERRPIRIGLESLLCGALSLCITSIVEIFQLPQSVVITIGGAIGFIGVTALREALLKIINKKVDK